MRKTYEVASATDRRATAEFVKREGQFLLPMVELVERTRLAIDEVVQVSRATPTPAPRPRTPRPTLDKLQRWVLTTAASEPRSSELAKASGYLLNQWTAPRASPTTDA